VHEVTRQIHEKSRAAREGSAAILRRGCVGKSRSRRIIAIALIALGVALALRVGRSWIASQQRRDLVIATGTPGGTYIRLGEQLARILEEHAGERIGSVEARPSAGSIQNLEWLASGEVDLAFGLGPVLAADERRDAIRGLMSLYTDLVQVVVREDPPIDSLGDLREKRVFVGAEGSGTRLIATRILQEAGLAPTDYVRVAGSVRSFEDASLALQSGRADAAFIVAAAPAKAVEDALATGCCRLLDVTGAPPMLGLGSRTISGRIYANQPDPVHTVGANALLVARADLPDATVEEIADALFDSLAALAEAHIRAQDIRIEHAFSNLPEPIELHPGVERFVSREQKKLLIATGTINGKYYQVGKRIELVLRQNGIPARVMQTGGSLENLEILGRNPRALAIVQYDAALAAFWSPRIYHTASLRVPLVRGMRRIATLHEEKVHALIRRDRIPPKERDPPSLAALEGRRVCVGPARSGTQALARAILHHHGITPREMVNLSIPDMVERLHSGELDAGFFVSHVPSEALKTIVHDPRNRLLSVDPRKLGPLLGPALAVSRIPPGTYGAQLEDEPPIETLATWALLVARDDNPFDVAEITRAVFEGAGFLGVSETAQGMARDLPSLPLHEGARTYYEEAGFLPTWSIDWLTVIWRSLAIAVILAGAYQGVLTARRDGTRRRLAERVLGVPLDPDYPRSTADLLAIRRNVRARGQRRPWTTGQLDASRVRELEALIAERVAEAKANLKRSLLAELRMLRPLEAPEVGVLQARYDSLESAIWLHLEDGELDPDQHALLLHVAREDRLEMERRAARNPEHPRGA